MASTWLILQAIFIKTLKGKWKPFGDVGTGKKKRRWEWIIGKEHWIRYPEGPFPAKPSWRNMQVLYSKPKKRSLLPNETGNLNFLYLEIIPMYKCTHKTVVHVLYTQACMPMQGTHFKSCPCIVLKIEGFRASALGTVYPLFPFHIRPCWCGVITYVSAMPLAKLV